MIDCHGICCVNGAPQREYWPRDSAPCPQAVLCAAFSIQPLSLFSDPQRECVSYVNVCLP